MIFFKVKAGALQLTMFVVVVIALLLAAFIILIHTHKTFKVHTDFVLETINNADRGINYTLNNSYQLHDTISVNLEDEDYKTLKVYRDYWGLFEKVTSMSSIKNKTFKKTALLGASQPEIDRTALYIEDNNKPLVVVGNTKIQGVTYLPKQGVRTGNISGHSYYGDQLIYGKQKTCTEFPKLHTETLNQIKKLSRIYETVESDQFIDLSENRTHKNSFYNPLQVIYSLETINLLGVNLTGHILVQSESKIIVDASANLKDIILIAPKIEVKNYVTGTFQAFASKEINVGSHCELNYPSSFILYDKTEYDENNKNLKETATIKIDKNTTIKGSLIYLGNIKNYKSQVFIEDSATIIGEVYCNKNLELLGNVYGSVFTSGFVANQSGSAYQNHIYNGKIIVNNLPQEFVGLSFKNSKKGIVKWLY
ncbi:hypothetical protein MBM09_08360 [Flaviramulus sp. BrNp1-15]|uniref:hypothetical protein n=1 Tax=Flaviramulus sp. BrNp1-15 TaxID=2916754 RepID=UPI001EE85590|nr:hypothetical protein [Flaviramulus sp. BrNp1-15]ULC57932.1 hypothetical protein MBM09_08360 [Flaviramulus sp. BrNp1-15]